MTRATGVIRWFYKDIHLPLTCGALVLLVYAVTGADAYELQLFTIAGCYALMVLGYQFIFGHAGALSLAQGTFFGVGAYVTGILGAQHGWNFPLTFPLSIALPVLLAAIIALPVLRLETHYFALATLGVGQVVWLIAINWEQVTGGANGLPGVPAISVFDTSLPRGLPLLVFVWSLVALAACAGSRFTAGLTGRRLQIMREDIVLAGALGINTDRLRFQALLLSAAYGGAAGALYVHTIRVIGPESLAFPIMVAALTMTVIGGSLRPAGAVLGALLLVHIPEWARLLENQESARVFEDWRLVAYGIALLAVIIAAPDGLIGLMARFRARLWPESPAPLPVPLALPELKPSAKDGPLLTTNALAKHFGGVAAVAGVDLTLQAGEILGLIGPNGSGKSTLVNLISGIEQPDSGQIVFQGKNIAGQPAWRIARAGIARSFQTSRLPSTMPVLDAIAVPRAQVADPRQARQTAMALLQQFDLEADAVASCGSLSTGPRRRLEVVRALALAPSLLLLDEPAAGLDADARAALAKTLPALAATGLSMLVVEHDLDFLMPLAHRVVCLDAGRIIASGTPDEVNKDPAMRQAYMGGWESNS